ncbi:uncharacterized protein BYT42DRAFT_647800 [Radiomyces spectabilis]|uniref:uncharacterized protein n=1 Tax=Radiomyces spectabilis TaxID=64574 RepID=UPI0022202C87|nr:uncharacterized protein BYT42DRAFT_647800 [Radiomyces spectabilis]KAI8370567.1 hypothetical protein BYT42DRAFT_647800 [Radiomyces spectabilis]
MNNVFLTLFDGFQTEKLRCETSPTRNLQTRRPSTPALQIYVWSPKLGYASLIGGKSRLPKTQRPPERYPPLKIGESEPKGKHSATRVTDGSMGVGKEGYQGFRDPRVRSSGTNLRPAHLLLVSFGVVFGGVEQSREEQGRAEQSRAEQSRAEQSRAEQSRSNPHPPSPMVRCRLAGCP